MKCTKCGQPVEDGAAACGHCGFPVFGDDSRSDGEERDTPIEELKTVRKLHFGLQGETGEEGPIVEPKAKKPKKKSTAGKADAKTESEKGPGKKSVGTKKKTAEKKAAAGEGGAEKAKVKKPAASKPKAAAQSVLDLPEKTIAGKNIEEKPKEADVPVPPETGPAATKPIGSEALEKTPAKPGDGDTSVNLKNVLKTIFNPPEKPELLKKNKAESMVEDHEAKTGDPAKKKIITTPPPLPEAKPAKKTSPPLERSHAAADLKEEKREAEALPPIAQSVKETSHAEPAWASGHETKISDAAASGPERTAEELNISREPAWAKEKAKIDFSPMNRDMFSGEVKQKEMFSSDAIEIDEEEDGFSKTFDEEAGGELDTPAPRPDEKSEIHVTVAGFARRFLAGALDQMVVLFLTGCFITIGLAVFGPENLPDLGSSGLSYLLALPTDYPVMAPAYLVIYIFFLTLTSMVFTATSGQSPGKLILNMRIIQTDGERVSLSRAVVRFFGVAVSVAPFFLGMLWMMVDSRSQGLHDKLAQTLVVRVYPEA